MHNFSDSKKSTNAMCASFQHLSFSYGDSTTKALDDICFDIQTGDFIGIVGPSGAGKSTLASCLSGAIPHHYTGQLSGKVTLEGADTFDLALSDISQIVGSVLQDIDAQMIAANVEDELLFGLENFGVDRSEIEERIHWALDSVGIQDLLYRDIATLSGGQKQKVAIAAILALRPKIMVLDEPTCALDPASSRKVYETLLELNQNYGLSIVVIEQKVALLAEFCKKIAVLNAGKLAYFGSSTEVFLQSEALRNIGVDSPRTARLSSALKHAGIVQNDFVYLSVDAAYEDLEHRFDAAVFNDTLEHKLEDDSSSYGEEKTELVRTVDSTQAKIVQVDALNFDYGPGTAGLSDISFSVRAGELVGIVGQNGAGKTTITKLLNGLLKPKSGSVVIAGTNTLDTSSSQLAHFVSTLFQNPDHQICKNTVLEEIAFSQELLGVDRQQALLQADVLCQKFSLPKDAAPFSLSRGQRQIVALASVLITKPKLLILDEPTSGLDYLECKIVMDAVEELRKSGTAVIMVCHDMEVAVDFATRLIVMAEGRILFDGDKRVAFADAKLMDKAFIRAPQMAELCQKLAVNISDARLQQYVSNIYEVRDLASLLYNLEDKTSKGARA